MNYICLFVFEGKWHSGMTDERDEEMGVVMGTEKHEVINHNYSYTLGYI